MKHFACISSSSSQETTSVGVNPQLSSPPPSSTIWSPLLWVGVVVGVGLSALFSLVATRLKKYAMQQALKTFMDLMHSQSNQFDSASFSPGSPFPFLMPSAPSTSSVSQSAVTVDVSATKVEAAQATNVKDEVQIKNEQKKIDFVDVSPEQPVRKSPFESFKDVDESSSFKESRVPEEASQNGAPSIQGFGDSPPGSQSTHQIGPSPEEVISKIMANLAMAFQNPKFQAPIMNCLHNPLNIAKYQNDEEVFQSLHISLIIADKVVVTTNSFNNKGHGNQNFSNADINSVSGNRARACVRRMHPRFKLD
ncbi:protein TIC 40, chloroplastic-like [Gastrolobium bilobum]|uniref:protein TIC 40, chloroplastic-like n=1 Tax=Gastrolobium bilobum TaxID=150636 RepID=UPI002AAF4724|nr:protein TIC 40, chloroplastic-like [Gastrolobium bilobum]